MKAAELRVDIGEHSQPPTQKGLAFGHLESIAVDIDAGAARQLSPGFGMNTGQSLAEFTATQPGQQANSDKHESCDCDCPLPAFLAPQQKNRQHRSLDDQGEHSAARAGKKDGAGHKYCDE